MKNKILFLFSCLILSGMVYSQCDYYMFQANKKITMGIFDKKGTQTGKLVYNINNVSKSGGTATSTYTTEMYDKKGRQLNNSTNVVKCSGGKLLMDMKMNLNQAAAFKDAKAKANSSQLEYPSSMSVGQTLPDAVLDLDIDMGGISMNMKMTTYDRKVIAKEKVSTPAGSWTTYKITNKMKTEMGGRSPMPAIENTEWFAPGFGIVKNESSTGKVELLSIE